MKQQCMRQLLQQVIPHVCLDKLGQHPASRVHELTPRLWKQLFAHNPLRSDLHQTSLRDKHSAG